MSSISSTTSTVVQTPQQYGSNQASSSTMPSPSLFVRSIKTADVERATDLAHKLQDHPVLGSKIDSTGYTPLNYASLIGNRRLTEAVLASPYTTVDQLSLKFACRGGHFETVEALAQAASPPILKSAGEALFEAAVRGSVESVIALINVGVPVNHRAPDGCQAIHLAAISGSVAMADALLRAGADPLSRTADKSDPSDCANCIGKRTCYWLLKAAKAEAELPPNHPQRKLYSFMSRNLPSHVRMITPSTSPTMSDDSTLFDRDDSGSEDKNTNARR